MRGGSPSWRAEEDKADGPAPCQQPRTAGTSLAPQHKHVWRMKEDNASIKAFLLWLNVDVKEKSTKNKVLAFLRSLSQRFHLTVNLCLHEDLYVCRHIHQ